MKNFILTFLLIALSTLSYPQWQMLNGPYETHGVKRLFNHPNGSLFAIGYERLYYNNTVYRSTNFGESWVKVLSGTNQLYSLFGDSSNGIYAGGIKVIYYSSDNGENWLQKSIPDPSSAVHSININSLGHILVGHPYGLHLSTNNGDNWSRKLNIDTRDILILQNDDIFAATSEGIYYSSDTGNTWDIRNSGMPSDYCDKIVKNSSGVLFTNNLWYGIYKSTNNGLSWFLPDS